MAALYALVAACGQPAQAAANLPLLTRISQIRQLTPDQAARGYPVRISGVVTYYSRTGPDFLGRETFMSSDTPDLFVQDSTAGIWVDMPKDSPPLESGQLLEMEGVTEAPDFAPQIGKPRYRVIGRAPLRRLSGFHSKGCSRRPKIANGWRRRASYGRPNS